MMKISRQPVNSDIHSVKTDSQNNSWHFTSVLHISKKTELKCDCKGSWKSKTGYFVHNNTSQWPRKKAVQCKMSVEMKEKVQILAEARQRET